MIQKSHWPMCAGGRRAPGRDGAAVSAQTARVPHILALKLSEDSGLRTEL